jgi:hypothetical protein
VWSPATGTKCMLTTLRFFPVITQQQLTHMFMHQRIEFFPIVHLEYVQKHSFHVIYCVLVLDFSTAGIATRGSAEYCNSHVFNSRYSFTLPSESDAFYLANRINIKWYFLTLICYESQWARVALHKVIGISRVLPL